MRLYSICLSLSDLFQHNALEFHQCCHNDKSLFFLMAELYIHTHMYMYICTYTHMCVCIHTHDIFFIQSHWSWSMDMFLMCVSLINSDFEHLFIYLLAIFVFSLEKCLFNFFAHFLNQIICFSVVLLYFFEYFIYLFLEREEGKEKERERNINVWLSLTRPLLGTWPTTQACALTGNPTGDPLVCRPSLNPLSHARQGTQHA